MSREHEIKEDPGIAIYNGSYHDPDSPCEYHYEYLATNGVAIVYKIRKIDIGANTPYDKSDRSYVAYLYHSEQYLLLITNPKKFWDKYVEPMIQNLEITKANFIKKQEAEDNEGTD